MKQIPWNKGKKTGLVPKSAFKKGDIRIIGKNNINCRNPLKAEKNPSWKGGETLSTQGYVLIRISDLNKYQLKHRYIMEQLLGRKLETTEQVHHIDGDKKNNDPSNLQLFNNASDHAKIHKVWLQLSN